MGTQERIEALKEKKAKIEKELAAIEARQKIQDRKEETRLKVVIGTAILNDAKDHPEIIDIVQKILSRSVKAPRDKELLTRKGWLPQEEATHQQGAAKAGAGQ